MHQSTTGPERDMPNADAVLAQLESLRQPTGYAQGRLRAVRWCRLEPDVRNRAEALARKWGLG